MKRALVASAALLAAYETTLAVARFRRRERVFAEARARAAQLGRPLVVVGDPDDGAVDENARSVGVLENELRRRFESFRGRDHGRVSRR